MLLLQLLLQESRPTTATAVAAAAVHKDAAVAKPAAAPKVAAAAAMTAAAAYTSAAAAAVRSLAATAKAAAAIAALRSWNWLRRAPHAAGYWLPLLVFVQPRLSPTKGLAVLQNHKP